MLTPGTIEVDSRESTLGEKDAWDVVVVGAGAAGLVAAAEAARRGHRTLLIEKNRKPGVKILMSGGTRCNLTQATDNRGIVAAFGPAGRFLHSALAALSVEQTIEMFQSEGLATKVETTGKIFPQSDKAADVLAALLRRLQRTSCSLALDEALVQITSAPDGFTLTTAKRQVHAQRLLITTGGQSYPGCGTIGEGYAWASQFGHTIVTPRPALVPLLCDPAWVTGLKGITIPDVALRVVEPNPRQEGGAAGRRIDARRGSLLFTHFGLSGPVVLDASGAVTRHPRPETLVLECDLLPNMEPAALEQWLRDASANAGKKQLGGELAECLPRRLIDSVLPLRALSSEIKMAELGQRGIRRAADALKSLAIPIRGTRGFGKAEVTAGGVALHEVDSRTMQSKLASNLFFAGEVLDLDGPIGGYNFQAAWSTGYLAGQSI
ncbi:MAG TPA: NAD(P)/FAD-dependent oxidoreductase [Pirellulales bacterium]|nr:NAD(P)/FAD-dependent oxidoreductase [Pirellulales bacterium]